MKYRNIILILFFFPTIAFSDSELCPLKDMQLAGFKGSVNAYIYDEATTYVLSVPKNVNGENYSYAALKFEAVEPKNSSLFIDILLKQDPSNPLNMSVAFNVKPEHKDSLIYVYYHGHEKNYCMQHGSVIAIPIKHNKSINFAPMTPDALKRAGY